MDQAFALMYRTSATWTDIESMTRQEREWLLTRLNKQLKDEAEAIKKVSKG